MHNYKIVLPAFVLVALVQLFIPAKMIFDREEVLEKGKEFRFKTAPIDPSDPFRGKYITLRYEETTTEVKTMDWLRGEAVYVLLSKDPNGFAKIQEVAKAPPEGNEDFLQAKVDYVSTTNDTNKLHILYPFNRFYMEESKAYNAEVTYRESLRDTGRLTYALVMIKAGEAVLKEVLIDGVPIREAVTQPE